MHNLHVAFSIICVFMLTLGAFNSYADEFGGFPDWSSNDTLFTVSIAVGDLDGNGTLDIIAANYFYPYTRSSLGVSDADDLQANQYGSLLVAYFNMSTSYTELHPTSGTRKGYNKVEVVDIDNDGDLDIVAGCVNLKGGDGENYYFVNDGSGRFSVDTFNNDPKQDTHDLATGDINNDGRMDIVTVGIFGDVYLWLNAEGELDCCCSPEISYEFVEERIGEEDIPGSAVELGDIDRDGRLDLYINYKSNPTIYENTGTSPYFETSNCCSTDFKENVSSAAFGWYTYDDSTYLALALGSFTRENGPAHHPFIGNSILIRDGSDLKEVVITYTSGGNYMLTTDIAWGDLNDDGVLDLVTGSYPSLTYSGGSLIWTDGYPQYFLLDDDNSAAIVISQDWNGNNSDLTTSIALGDIDGQSLNLVTEYFSVSGQNGKLVYLDHFPMHRMVAVYYYDDNNPGWYAVADSDYCYHLKNGWVSFDNALTSDSFWVSYQYSDALDLIVGNDGKNRVYYHGGSASSVSNPSPFNVSSIPDTFNFYNNTSITTSQMDTTAIGFQSHNGMDEFNEWAEDAPDIDLTTVWVFWQDLEYLRGLYFCDWVDEWIISALNKDYKMILFAEGNGPEWTYPATQTTSEKHSIDEKYHAFFARNLVNRYRPSGVLNTYMSGYWPNGDGVRIYGFINEPDYDYSPTEQSPFYNSPDALSNAMKYNYGMVKAIDYSVDGDFTVFSPNFGNELDTGNNYWVIDSAYIDTLYEMASSPLKNYCDVICQQYYSTYGDYDPATNQSNEQKNQDLEDLIQLYDDTSKTVMSIEWEQNSVSDQQKVNFTITQIAEMFQYKRMKWNFPGIEGIGANNINQMAKLLKGYRYKENIMYYDVNAADDTLTTIKDYIFENPDYDTAYVHQFRADSLVLENTLRMQLITDTSDIEGDNVALDYLNYNHFERQVNEYPDTSEYAWVTFLQAEIDTTPFYMSEIVDGTDYDLVIPLEGERWNWISLNIYPGAVSCSTIFVDVNTDSLKIENYQEEIGDRNSTLSWTWDPPEGFTWDMQQGYKVWTLDDCTLHVADDDWYDINLSITFTPSDYDTSRKNFFIAYTPCWDMPCSTAFDTFLNWTRTDSITLVWAANNEGTVYIPELAEDETDYFMMRQGEGYYLRMKSGNQYVGFKFTNETSPPLDWVKGNPLYEAPEIKSSSQTHFQYKKHGYDLYPIVLENISIDSVQIGPGDEIGVFMWDTLCVGARVLDCDSSCVISAWKDDPMTEEIDGYLEGEMMNFKYYNKIQGVEYNLQISYLINMSESPYFSSSPIFGHKDYAILFFSALPYAAIPISFKLHQNYPNPFNPSTTIRFDLPEPSEVRLSIFNVLGQKVTTLIYGVFPAGFQSARWDGKSGGAEVSSGLYFYRLEAKSLVSSRHYRSVRKLVVLR